MYRLTFRGLVILFLIVAAMALVSYIDRRRDPLRKPFSPLRWCWARLRRIDFVDAVALSLFVALGALWAKSEFVTAPTGAPVAHYVERLLGIGIFVLGWFYLFLLVRMFVEDAFGIWLRRREKKADQARRIEPPRLPQS